MYIVNIHIEFHISMGAASTFSIKSINFLLRRQKTAYSIHNLTSQNKFDAQNLCFVSSPNFSIFRNINCSGVQYYRPYLSNAESISLYIHVYTCV